MNTETKNTQALPSDQYDAFEIHPCILLDRCGKPVKHDDPSGMFYEQCDEDVPDIAIWALYGHLSEGGLEHISDHLEKTGAVDALQILEKEQFRTEEAV